MIIRNFSDRRFDKICNTDRFRPQLFGYFQTGQYENAIAEFVKIPLLSRKTELQWEASALYYSGQAYEKLGRIGEAKRMYSEIVKRPGIDVVLKKEAQKRIKEIEL